MLAHFWSSKLRLVISESSASFRVDPSTYDLDFDDAGSDENVGQARLKPRAAPQWRFGAGAEIEVEYEGVDNWHAAFVESVVRVRGDNRYNVVIDEGTLYQVPRVHGDRLRPRS